MNKSDTNGRSMHSPCARTAQAGLQIRPTSRSGFVLLTMLVFATLLSLLLTTALTVSYRLHADNRRAKQRLQTQAGEVPLRRETAPPS